MRIEDGQECPATLGEYRDFCAAINPNSRAVAFLDKKITTQGRDEPIIASDSQMRAVLVPMLENQCDHACARIRRKAFDECAKCGEPVKVGR